MLKLILADNQAIFRAGIAKVLAVEDEMRIVAQAQTPEQMFMALDKFRAAVLVVAAGFHNDFAAIVQAAMRPRPAWWCWPIPAKARSGTWRTGPTAWSIAT
jgi:DNA-binding NarL/FixJ family response regulator